MASTLTWLDYSERDRRRALDVIDLFRETGTVDELGLAGVRNSFSDLFFPRHQHDPDSGVLLPARAMDVAAARAFAEAHRARPQRGLGGLNSTSTAGCWRGTTRGACSGPRRGTRLKRLPSEVYWGGLRSWGIRTFSGHMWAYFRSLDGFYRRGAQSRSTPRDPEGRSAPPANWHPHVPAPPSGFPYENVSVALRPQDAEYLRDRIQARHAESLLAVLAGRADPSGSQGRSTVATLPAQRDIAGAAGAASRCRAIRRLYAGSGPSLQPHALRKAGA